MHNLRAKRENGAPLKDKDYLTLIFLPLMKSKNSEEEQAFSEEEQALKAADLAGREPVPEKDKNYIIAALIVITDKYMSKQNKLLEMLKMTEIEQWLREEKVEEQEAIRTVEVEAGKIDEEPGLMVKIYRLKGAYRNLKQ